MIKEGENIVLFKLRIKDELDGLALSNPELLDEYKKSTIESIANLARAERISPKEAYSAIEVLEPNYYEGRTYEESKAEAEADVKAAMPFLVGIALVFFGLVGWMVHNLFMMILNWAGL